MDNIFGNALQTAIDEMQLEIASTAAQVREAQQLRHKVYCEERGYEPGEAGLEMDAFDVSARHALVRARATGEVLGTVRVVLGNDDAGQGSFPMNRVCEKFVLAPLLPSATGEISRFALTRDRAGVSPASCGLMRLFLMRGIVEISGTHQLTHWCAIMEQSLLRLLRGAAIHFQHVGPIVEFHGIRQPAVSGIETLLGRIRREKPQVWGFITNHGALWQEQDELRRNVG